MVYLYQQLAGRRKKGNINMP